MGVLAISACMALPLASGCASRGPVDDGRSSVYQSQQLASAADKVRQSLAISEFLQGRTAASPEIRLLCDKMENFSSDRLTRTDQLAAVWRVASDDGMLELLRSRNVKVYFGPRDDDLLAAVVGTDWRKWSSPEKPTHILGARFASLVRSGGAAGQLTDTRSDDFIVTFTILDDRSGQQVWSDSARFKRTSRGLQID